MQQGWYGGGFLLHRCKTLNYVFYYSWIFLRKGGTCWSSQAPIAPAACKLAMDLLGCTLTKALLELNLCLSTKVTSQVSIWTLGTLLCCWLQPGYAFLGGADTADHVAVWPSGHSLLRRGHGSGEALWAVACDPILVGKQNCHSRSYPVFRAHEADGPSR